MKNLGIYIHIPFCERKCDYCGFLSFDCFGEEARERYVNALIGEIEAVSQDYTEKVVDTVFVGGGTPSILSAAQIGKIMGSLDKCFCLTNDAEITMESNPGTLTYEKLRGYKMAGINRLSMGVQSLEDEFLKSIGRIHTEREAYEGFDFARKAGFSNINMDLMFALPNHTQGAWEQSLEKAVKLSPEHISFYSLQIEENTPFYDRLKNSKLSQISDDEDRKMYHFATNYLKSKGYIHYEISNASKKGYECKHNLKYWSFDEYLGLGLAAHSFVGGKRFVNTENLEEYFQISESCISSKKYNRNNSSCERMKARNLDMMSQKLERNVQCWQYKETHTNTIEDSIFEYVFTALRTARGVDFADFKNKIGEDFWFFYANKNEIIDRWVREGFVKFDNAGIRLTEKGIDISNSIMAEFYF